MSRAVVRVAPLLQALPEHLAARKRLLPPFHGEAVRRSGEVMADIARLARLRPLVRRVADMGGLVMLGLVQRDPALYPEPDAFRPERWLNGEPAGRASSWIPFGGGRRRCLGAAFASFEMKTILRTVLQSLELEPARPERQKMPHITVVPAKGTRVRVSAG